MPDIIVHDKYGFTQAMRRALFRAILEEEIVQADAEGKRATYTEEPDGFTLYLDGAYDSRITYAELAALETDPEAMLRGLR